MEELPRNRICATERCSFLRNNASVLRFGKADATDEDIKKQQKLPRRQNLLRRKKKKIRQSDCRAEVMYLVDETASCDCKERLRKNKSTCIFDDSFSALMKTDTALRKGIK